MTAIRLIGGMAIIAAIGGGAIIYANFGAFLPWREATEADRLAEIAGPAWPDHRRDRRRLWSLHGRNGSACRGIRSGLLH